MATKARLTGAANTNNQAALGDFQTPAYAASIAIATKMAVKDTVVRVGTLTGNLSLTIGVGSSTTHPYAGDTITCLFLADGSNRTVTFSTGFTPSATLVVTASKRASASFMFDGTSWVETGRAIGA